FPVFDERFADPDLRRAISMVIDREGINKAVYNGDYFPADSLIPSVIPGHRDNACGEACTYDPAKAKELFDKAGGFEGTMELYFSNAQPTYAQWMRIVANSLRDNLGIQKIEFRQVPASDYFSMLRAREERGPYRQNWEADYPSPQNYLENLWGSDGNRMGWKNEEFDDLIAQANRTADERKAIELYNRAEDVAVREMPMIPLWTWARQGGHSEKVGNVTVTPYATGLLATEVTVKWPAMWRYAVRRLLQAVPVFFGTTLLIYAMVFALPGDPIQALAGDKPVPDSVLRTLRDRYNLDDP